MSHERIELSPDHKYAVNGVMVPGVSEILEIISPFVTGDAEATYYAAEFGSEIHDLTAMDDMGILPEGSIPDHAMNMMAAWAKFRAKEGFEVEEIELRVYSATHRFAGTLDRRGRRKGRPCILDIKTGDVNLIRVGPQTAAYDLADREWSGIGGRPRDRFAVKLLPNRDYLLIPCTDKRDQDVFLFGLQIWNWRHVKHGSY
jgi:hypothetical protein